MAKTRQALLFGGVAAPLLYALADAAAGIRYGGYSFRDQTISELGAIGAPSQALFSALLVPVYILLTAFGIGVWREGAERPAVRTAGGLLVALGVMALTVGRFVPMRPRGTEQGLIGLLHLIEGGVAVAMIVAAITLAATALGAYFRFYSVVTLVAMLVFGAWSGMDAPSVEAGLATPYLGVKERVFWYAYQAWFAVLALTLLRQGRNRTP